MEVKQRIAELPAGKIYHFFFIQSEENKDYAFSVMNDLEKRFGVKCVSEGRNEISRPGVDKFGSFRQTMINSVKVVLLLSKHFADDGWCIFQKNLCLAASLDSTIPCIVPVILEEMDNAAEFSPFATMPVVYAMNPRIDDVSLKIVSTISDTDMEKEMIPFECINVFARFENGYSVEIPVERVCSYCNRPSRYKFYLGTELEKVLRESRIKVDDDLLHDIVQCVNKQPLMKKYDFMKKRNICCWSSVFLVILAILLSTIVSALYTLLQFNEDRPSVHSDPFPSWFVWVLAGPCSIVDLYFILAVALVLGIPKFYSREKWDISLQDMLCKQFLRRCIENDVVIVFSGRKNRQPSLQIVRYNFEKCRKFLVDFIRRFEHRLPKIDKTIEQYAESLMENTITETTKIMCINYENLLEAPNNRHNLKRGKMCICQLIERQLRQQLTQYEERENVHLSADRKTIVATSDTI